MEKVFLKTTKQTFQVFKEFFEIPEVHPKKIMTVKKMQIHAAKHYLLSERQLEVVDDIMSKHGLEISSTMVRLGDSDG